MNKNIKTAIILLSLSITYPAWAGNINLDFITAAANGDVSSVQTLLAKGAAIDARDDVAWSALMWAAKNGHADVVRILLDMGADINAKNLGGWTALMYARNEKHYEIFRAILSKNTYTQSELKPKTRKERDLLRKKSLKRARELVRAATSDQTRRR